MPGSIPGSPTIFAVTSGAKNQPSGWFFRLMRDGLRGQTFESPNMRSYSFTHAITRQPPASAIHGLRAVDTGAPDLAQMRAHHADYIAALKSTGAVVVELPALEAFPDSLFVEDTALCLPEGAVVMRPGAPSRLGEAAEMAPHLRALYGDVRAVTGAENFIEAGDILTTETEILVGRSARTNAGGVAELAGIVADWGYRLREVFTPPGVLHFKTDCSLLDAETILATERLDASGCFKGSRVIHTVPGEEACANAIRFNDLVLFPKPQNPVSMLHKFMTNIAETRSLK